MRAYIRLHPVSLGLIAAMWVFWFGSRALSHSNWPWLSLRTLGYSVADPWPHVLTSGLTTTTFSGLLIATATLAIFGALAERRLGSMHYLLAGLVSQVLGVAGGAGIALLAEYIGLSAGEFERERILAPLWIIGVLAYSSGVFPPLWRSRMRLAIGVYAVTRILYAGTLRDTIVFSGAVLGILASYLLQRRLSARDAACRQIRRRRHDQQGQPEQLAREDQHDQTARQDQLDRQAKLDQPDRPEQQGQREQPVCPNQLDQPNRLEQRRQPVWSNQPAQPAQLNQSDRSDQLDRLDQPDQPKTLVQPLRSPRERRIVLGMIAFAVFLGPLFAAAGPNSAAVFAPSSLFVWHGSMAQVHELCAIDHISRACMNAIYFSGHIGIGGFLANQLPLGLMLVSAWGLTKGRRLAYWLTIGGSALTIAAVALELASVSHISSGNAAKAAGRSIDVANAAGHATCAATAAADIDVTGLVIVTTLVSLPWIALIGLLIAMRKDFMVHTNASVRRSFVLRLVGTASLCAAVWAFGAWLVRDQFTPVISLSQILHGIGIVFVPPSLALSLDIPAFPHSTLAGIISIWPGIIFWLVTLISLIFVLRSSPEHESALAHQHARELLMHGTGDHISWMTLWPYNRYWFDPEGNGYVAFRLYSLVAVTLGGPVLTNSDCNAQTLARRFEHYATRSGWSVAWYSVCEEFARGRESAGWHTVQVAEESVLDASSEPAFTGKKFQDIRTARNHAARENIHAVASTWSELSPATQADIVTLSDQWVSDKALPEMGFTLGGVKTLNDPEVHLVLAIDDAEHVHGVTSWLPIYVDGTVQGWILDFMRRDAHGFHLVVDFLIAESWIIAHQRGLHWLSLSGAPLSHTKQEEGENSSPLLKMLDTVGGAMEPLYGFRSLASFKRKFQPEHRSWYLCYRDELGLPAIGLAVSHAYIPDLTFGQLLQTIRQLPTARAAHRGAAHRKNRAAHRGEKTRRSEARDTKGTREC